MSTIQKNGILLIDDHALFRAGVKLLISRLYPPECIYEAEKLTDIEEIKAPIEIVLLDIHLPGLSGLSGIALLKKRWSSVKVIVLSASDDLVLQQQAIQSGADLFLHKNSPPEKICHVIKETIEKSHSSSPAIQRKRSLKPSEKTKTLSPRQLQILDLLYMGKSNKIIAKELYISENTVRNHVASMMRFFNVNTRVEMVMTAQKSGYLSEK